MLSQVVKAFDRALLGPGLHQPATRTRLDRYPEIFVAASEAVRADARVLSFGCSTGEELVSLRRHFVAAEIVGVDINPACLRAARRRCRGDARTSVRHTHEPLDGAFDAIFCMAVFQRGELRDQAPADASGIYPFDRFERELVRLDAHLRVGGVLAVDEASYRVSDTSLAERYRPIEVTLARARVRPRYDRHSRLTGVGDEPSVLWRKVADAPSAPPDAGQRSRLNAFLARSPRDRWLLAEAGLLVEIAVGAVSLLPFRVVARLLGLREGRVARPVTSADVDRARTLAAMVRAAARHAPIPAVCLPQSLALFTMLARRGISASLRLGVRREKGRLHAHAWVIVGDTIVLGAFRDREYRQVGSFS